MILSIGRVGSEKSWDQLVQKYLSEIIFIRLGEQPTERISQFLLRIDFGLATSQWGLIGKSSTVAAMLEFGVPVIVNREDDHFETTAPEITEPMLIRCDDKLEARLVCGIPKGPRHSRRENIARQFVFDLEGAAAKA